MICGRQDAVVTCDCEELAVLTRVHRVLSSQARILPGLSLRLYLLLQWLTFLVASVDLVIGYWSNIAAWTGFCATKVIPYQNLADWYAYSSTVQDAAASC
jgi:hypothetical protein